MGWSFASIVILGLMGQHGPNCRCNLQSGGRITPPGPGAGWGFPNGNPDGYGWVDFGTTLPIGGDRIPDYFFRRQYSLPPEQVFFPTYYNAYITRGQRFIPYVGAGGWHPAGGPAPGSAVTPVNPYRQTVELGQQREAQVPLPRFTGRTEAPPVPTGGSGLIP